MIQRKVVNDMFSLIFSVLTIVVVKGELVNFGCRKVIKLFLDNKYLIT